MIRLIALQDCLGIDLYINPRAVESVIDNIDFESCDVLTRTATYTLSMTASEFVELLYASQRTSLSTDEPIGPAGAAEA